MARFHPNQSVVCISKSLNWEVSKQWWKFWKRNKTPNGPKFNEVVTIECYSHSNYVWLKEYAHMQTTNEGLQGRGAYNENIFEPLVSDEELYEALKEEKTKA